MPVLPLSFRVYSCTILSYFNNVLFLADLTANRAKVRLNSEAKGQHIHEQSRQDHARTRKFVLRTLVMVFPKSKAKEQHIFIKNVIMDRSKGRAQGKQILQNTSPPFIQLVEPVPMVLDGWSRHVPPDE